MLESIVGSVLNRFLGEYFENFSSANLKVGLWNGDAKIENLQMTQNALNVALNLPLIVTNGHLQHLQIAIPWKNLGGEPTVLQLEGLKIEAEVVESIHHSPEDELRSKQKLLEYIETKLDAEAVVDSASTNSEAYTNKVLKNLHIEIRNIEIKVADKALGSTFGIYLGSLTLKTANEDWKEVGVMDHDAMHSDQIFKVARLENLAIYIDTDGSTSPQYVLEPLKVISNIKHNLKPNENDLRGAAFVELESIGLRLTSAQFRFFTSSMEKLERIRRNAKYRKGRPEVSISVDAKAWWQFAVKTVINLYKINEKTKLFNRNYIQDYCIYRKEYRELYKEKLTGKVVAPQRMDMLEQILDVPTLVELRQTTRAMVKRAKQASSKNGWFGSWFGADQTVDEDLTIDDEDRDRLSSLLDGVDVSKIKDPPGVVRYQLDISIPLFKIELANVLTIALDDTKLTTKLTPGCKSKSFLMSCQRLRVDSALCSSSIISSNLTEGGEFFSFEFITNAFDTEFVKIADRALKVTSTGVDIYYADEVARSLHAFFRVGDGLNEIRQVLQDEYVQRYEQSRAGMGHIISTRSIFLIDIDLQAPKVTIPGFDGQALELNFGRLLVKSRKAQITSLAEFDQSKYTLEQLQDLVYANYDIKLVDLEISVRKSSRQIDACLPDRHRILEPLSINFELQRLDSKAQATVELAKFRVNGRLSNLSINFSDYRMAQVAMIINSIRRAWRRQNLTQADILDLDLPDAPIYIPEPQEDFHKLTESYSNLMVAKKSSDTFFDANDESFTNLDDTAASQYSSSLADSAAIIKIIFAVNKVSIDLTEEQDDSVIVDGKLFDIEFVFRQTKFITNVVGSFAKIDLVYKPSHKERMVLFQLGAAGQPAVTMEFDENRMHTVIESDLLIEGGSLKASVDPAVINHVMGFVKGIINSTLEQDSSLSMGSSPGDEAKSIDSNSTLNAELSTQKIPSVNNIVIKSRNFDIDLYSYHDHIAQMILNDGEAGIVIRDKQTTVKIRVGTIKVIDPKAVIPVYRNVVTVIDSSSTFFDMKIDLFDIDLKTQANDVTARQGHVYLRTGSIKLVFFQKWIDYISIYYPLDFPTGDIDWAIIKSNDGSFFLSKYTLDVEIMNPIVLIPASTSHNLGFRGDCGKIVVTNKFESVTTTNLKFHPIINKIEVICEDMCLYNMANYSTSVTQITTIPIVDETFTVLVDMNAGWEFHKDLPGMIVTIILDDTTFHLKREDLVTMWAVLGGNIWIRYDPNQIVEHLGKRRRGRILSTDSSEDSIILEEEDIHIDMKATVKIKELQMKVYVNDDIYSSISAQNVDVDYTSMTNLVGVSTIMIEDILLYDERKQFKESNGTANCMVQKQSNIREPAIIINFQTYTKPAKQITDMDIKSMRLVVVIDFILQLQDIFVYSMSEDIVFECTPKSENMSDISQIKAHMQFQAKIDRPHIILMSDLRNAQDSSCIKMGANLRVAYIASLYEQNLDISIEQPQIYSVPFKRSFGTDERVFGHQIMNSEIVIGMNMLTSPRSTMITIKCPDLDLTMNPEAVNTLFLSYNVVMGEDVAEVIQERASVVLDVQRTVNPKDLWFIPNPLGSDVDSTGTLEMYHISRAETDDELFTMNLPKLTIRLESSVMQGIAHTQIVPLMVINSSLKVEVRDWSSDMYAEVSTKFDTDIYHESRPGYEAFIEKIESNPDHPDSKLVQFGMRMSYKVSNDVGHKRDGSLTASDEDGFSLIENTPQKKLVISSDVPLNMNVSSEAIDVIDHLSTVYGHSLSDAAKGTISDAPAKRRSRLHAEEVKAPIIVINETGTELTISTKDWLAFDPSLAKLEAKSPQPSPTGSLERQHPSRIVIHPSGTRPNQSQTFSVGSSPGYFQFAPHIHIRSLSAYVIGLSPIGFSHRQVDVSSLQENGYTYISNNNANFKIVLLVKVEGITGARKITIQSNVSITNAVPFPLELINGAMSSWIVNEGTTNAALPIKMINSAGMFDVTFADPDVSKADNPIVYSTKNSFSQRLRLSVRGEGRLHHMTAQVEMTQLKRTSLYKVHVRFCPCFSLKNWLPYPLTCMTDNNTNQTFVIQSGRELPFLNWKQNSSLVLSFHVRGSEHRYLSEKYLLPRQSSKRDISYFKFIREGPDGRKKECFLKKQIKIDADESILEVFAPYWVINGTGLNLDLRPVTNMGRDSDQLIQLDCDPFVILPTKHDEMTISVMKSGKSSKTPINTIGHMGTTFCPPSSADNQSYLLGIHITAVSFGLTTMVKFTPFYHLVNQTDEELEVREVFKGMIELDKKSLWFSIGPKEKIPFWPLDSRHSQIMVRKPRTNFVSERISYHSQIQGILLNMGDVEGLYCEVSHNDNECLITFTPYFVGAAAFDLINLTGFAIHYRQENQGSYRHLYPAHRIIYTWRYPSEEKILELRIDDKQPVKCLIPESGLNAMQVKTLRVSQAEVFVVPVFIGTQRTIVVTQDPYHRRRLLSSDKQITELDYQFQLGGGIGLSLVDAIRREEVSFISVRGTGGVWYQQREGTRKWRECQQDLAWTIEARWRERATRRFSSRSVGFKYDGYLIDLNRQTMTNGGRTWTLNRNERQAIDIRYLKFESSSSLELSLQSVQIDNTSQTPKWPVIFARVPPKQSVAAVEVADNLAMVFVSVIWDKSHDSNITKYRTFHVLLQECFLQIEVNFVARLLQAFAEKQRPTKMNDAEVFRHFMEDMDAASKPISREELTTSSISFFEHMHLSPIRLHFKFSLEYGAEDNIVETLDLVHKLQSFGVGQIAKGDVSLQLSYFQTDYEYFSDNIIRERIMAHYRFQIIQQLYKFLLGVELLGNPVKVAVDMFSGVKDFFYEPYQGITQSGEEFLEGIGSGTSKLFSGVVGGATGGLSRLTHNLASVSAAATFDKEYQNRRAADNANTVKGVKEGVARAGEKLFTGFFQGITGVVEKPLTGAKADGASGFFKGIGKGVTGLVAKPLTGIVDAASTTLAGVQHQLDTKTQVERVRFPRVVDEGYLQPYRFRLAFAQHSLRGLEDDVSLETPLGLGYSDNDRVIIVVTSRSICVIDTRTTTGRLKAEIIRQVADANIIYGGDRGQATIQLKDNNGQLRQVKIKSIYELDHLKRAISKNKEISSIQEFDGIF